MSVSIKVAVRCRPFTIDDDLGVSLTQSGEEEGEIALLNSGYSTTRFAFTYAWWSAFGYARHVRSNAPDAEGMELIDQHKVYMSVGTRIKADLLAGNAVVLFAYGLSGSGKTFTVFGPDAVDEPEAWFKHSKTHPMWGVFPRLAYEVFQEKEDGWKITMKYFQNVVDTVRDLMSPIGKEMHYKNGMKKDADGFTDIDWCSSAVLNSWDDLRNAFKAANARKAIAPTQFNHQSTRGHCIMTLEVERPHPEMTGMKRRGRVYVCDLAGTEPAGDIVYALYEKKTFESGDIEHKYIGPHNDVRKTKELQDQGKKINLSLSEMAQFFMKMAEAMAQGTLKPGRSIPGCNSYFLCKYLKDTMLQARTYLFCAIRPEVTYHRYTFSTLGFAKNASVVKLKPKMATVQATPAERKLMAELEQMKTIVEQLRKEQAELVASPAARASPPESLSEDAASPAQCMKKIERTHVHAPAQASPDPSEDLVEPRSLATEESKVRRESISKNAEQVSKLQEMLAAKQLQLREVLSGGGGDKAEPTPEERQLDQQREEYGRRGISLSHFEANTRLPHLVNVDEDPFRHNRFVYLLKKKHTVFGPQGDVQPMSLSVQRKHCSVAVKRGEGGESGTVTLIGGRGEVLHNGKRVRKQEQVVLSPYDRVAIGGELLLFRWRALEEKGQANSPPSAEEAVIEFKRATQARSGRRRSAQLHAMEEQLKDLQMAKAKAEEEAKSAAAERAGKEQERWSTPFNADSLSSLDDAHIASAIRSAEDDVQMLLPHVKEVEQFMQLFEREYLSFDVSLQRSQGDTFEVAASVQIKNARTGQSCFVSTFEFLEQRSIFADEVIQLQAAFDNGREYAVPAEHDPSLLLLQGTHELGVATLFTEPIVYMMATEDEERFSMIKSVRAPYGEVGKLESAWHPLLVGADGQTFDPEAGDGVGLELPDIDSPNDLIGLSWAYRFEIKAGLGLPLTCASAYCQYDLLGETFTTETVQPDPPSTSPMFSYSFVHRVDKVTREIIQALAKPLNVYLYVGPHVQHEKPEDAISTQNPRVSERFDSLRRPNTPLPTGLSSARCASPLEHLPRQRCAPRPDGSVTDTSGNADVGAATSWGFAGAGTGETEAASPAADDVVAANLSGAEMMLLREENELLKEQLRRAQAEIKLLRSRDTSAVIPAARGGRGVGMSASSGAMLLANGDEGSMKSVHQGRADEGRNGAREHHGDDSEENRQTCSARESKSRKKIEIDSARATDAVVEAAREEHMVPGVRLP